MHCNACGNEWAWASSERMGLNNPGTHARLAIVNVDVAAAAITFSETEQFLKMRKRNEMMEARTL